ncbi:hypothetical protein OF83DRAFT_1083308 [Amylostereum chailletii]|nr:hypothetical protein OF83DRAFT_1083308 [Amylostereum chailletii]
MDTRRESEICLTAAGPGFPTRAQLDFSVIYDHRSLWTSFFIGDPNVPKTLDVLWKADTRLVELITLLLFPGEGKRVPQDQNKNRLIHDLSTCLHQQESLGLPLDENFGFVASNGVVQIYSMRKLDKEITRYEFLEYPFATFNLRQPLEFLRLYSFLCKLADHLDTHIIKDFRKLTLKEIIRTLEQHQGRDSWRADNPLSDNIRRSSGGDGGGGGDDGPPSQSLSVENIKAHTKMEGSTDILNHTGMSKSSQS